MNYFNYFSEIEETFIRRRGRNLLLSPLDWALIESWQEREIPLHIVVRAIENVFDAHDKKPKNSRPIKSLFYCKDEIESQYAGWLAMQSGKSKIESSEPEVRISENTENTLFSDETIVAHINKITDELNAAKKNADGRLSEVLEKILSRVAEFQKSPVNAEKLEGELEDLDKRLDAFLLKFTDAETLSKMKAETTKQVARYKNQMEVDVYQRTFDLMLLKRLRERHKIPYFSLFYL